MTERAYHDKATLERLYLHEGKTTREIADELGASNGTISRWLDKHDIPTRENWKEGVAAAAEANRRPWAQLNTLQSGYEYWQQKERVDGDSVNRMVYVHRLLAVAEFGTDAVTSDMDVHHKNGVPWDNRPSNIELIDRAEHAAGHNTGELDAAT